MNRRRRLCRNRRHRDRLFVDVQPDENGGIRLGPLLVSGERPRSREATPVAL
jgi:hypothetical protein